MSNLYEIHVSINLRSGEEELRWLWFCKDHNFHNIRVLNVQGEHNVQNMIGKWCHRENEEEASQYAEEIGTQIRDAGFEVVRVKAEAMMMSRQFDGVELKNDPSRYWEFHFKVVVKDAKGVGRLVNLMSGYDGVGVSLSAYGKTGFPIVTIRQHHETREHALGYKDAIIGAIKREGFHIHDKLQAECSVYDTNPDLDAGWLSNGYQ